MHLVPAPKPLLKSHSVFSGPGQRLFDLCKQSIKKVLPVAANTVYLVLTLFAKAVY
jgi:hypothetical protein